MPSLYCAQYPVCGRKESLCEGQKEKAWVVEFWRRACGYFVEGIEEIGAAEFVQCGTLGEKWMKIFRDVFSLSISEILFGKTLTSLSKGLNCY